MARLVSAQPPKPSPALPDLKAIAGMIEKGQLGPAELQLRQILAQGGGPLARDLLGTVLARQGRVGEAEREFKQALAANPALLDARQHLARLYLTQKRETEAVAELRQAALQGPLERDLALKLASVEESEDHPAEAERQLRAVADRFSSAQALVRLARLQSGQKNLTGALECLRKARTIAPNSEEVLSALAQTSLAAGAPLPAIQVLASLRRMCPAVAQYHYLLGLALMQGGDMPAAVEPLKEAERLEPNHTPTLVALGVALNRGQLFAAAKPYLLRGVELEPHVVEAVAALAEAEEGLGELAPAEAYAQRALARAGENATANLVLGMVRLRQERYEEARDALLKAAAVEPGSVNAQYQLSVAYARLNDQVSSEKHLALYRQKLRETEERIKELREKTGLSSDGMLP